MPEESIEVFWDCTKHYSVKLHRIVIKNWECRENKRVISTTDDFQLTRLVRGARWRH